MSLDIHTQLSIINKGLEKGYRVGFRSNGEFVYLKNGKKLVGVTTELETVAGKITEFVQKNREAFSNEELKTLQGSIEKRAMNLENRVKGFGKYFISEDNKAYILACSKLLRKIEDDIMPTLFEFMLMQGQERIGLSREKDCAQRGFLVKNALDIQVNITANLPKEMRRLQEHFTTEKNFYKGLKELCDCSQDPKFLALLKNKKIGGYALTDREITQLFGPYHQALGVAEDYFLALSEVQTLINEGKEDEALKKYKEIVLSQYSRYFESMKYAIFSYKHFFTKTEIIKKFKAVSSKVGSHFDFAGLAVTPLQNSLRIAMFAEDISHAIQGPELTIEHIVSDLANGLNTYERMSCELHSSEKINFDVLKDDSDWKTCLKNHNLDLEQLEVFNEVYAIYGEAVKNLADQPTRENLKNELVKVHQINKKFTTKVGSGEKIEAISQAIIEYRRINPLKAQSAFPFDFLNVQERRVQYINALKRML